jgi:hypothetical protein
MVRFCRLALACAVVVAAPPAVAEQAPVLVSLDWKRLEGAESCIDQTRLETEVEARLDRRVFVPSRGARMRVTGTIAQVPNSQEWVASLEARDTTGRLVGVRVIRTEAERCEELDSSLALVLAIAIESAHQKIVVHVPPPKREEPKALWGGSVAPTFWGSWGLLPGFAVGAGLRAGVEPPSFWPLELELAGYFPKNKDVGGRGAEFVGWQAGVSLCPTLAEGAARVRLCGGGQTGVLQGAGYGFSVPRQVTSTLANGVVGGEIEVPVGRLAPRFRVGALFPFARDRFVYGVGNETFELHRPSPVVLSFDLGLALRIP